MQDNIGAFAQCIVREPVPVTAASYWPAGGVHTKRQRLAGQSYKKYIIGRSGTLPIASVDHQLLT